MAEISSTKSTTDFWELLVVALFLFAGASFFLARDDFAVKNDDFQKAEAQKVETQKIDISVTAEALKICLGKSSSEINLCLDSLFREYLENKTSLEALALVEELGSADSQIRLSCHPIIHAIGRETFRKKGTIPDSFAACDQTCHSGCYHGAIERFLRGEESSEGIVHLSEQEIAQRVKGACSVNDETRFRFQCLHGLGHAVMFFLDYNLEKALQICEDTGDPWSQSSCWGGVFMENVFSSSPQKRDLSQTDYHYPCSKLDEKYRADCYMMQTTRMTEMGLGIEGLFGECRKAGNFSRNCFQSIGRDLSNDARIMDPRITSKKCEGLDAAEQDACIRGVIYALIDNTWSGRYAFPFCDSFEESEAKTYCFTAGFHYLENIFAETKQDLARECETYAPKSQVCKRMAGR